MLDVSESVELERAGKRLGVEWPLAAGFNEDVPMAVEWVCWVMAWRRKEARLTTTTEPASTRRRPRRNRFTFQALRKPGPSVTTPVTERTAALLSAFPMADGRSCGQPTSFVMQI